MVLLHPEFWQPTPLEDGNMVCSVFFTDYRRVRTALRSKKIAVLAGERRTCLLMLLPRLGS